jgi:hypothetical protein
MPKIHRKLTDREIKEAKPKDKNYFLFDDAKLRLLIRPSGTKVWQYPYQLNEKNNTVTLGKYGDRTGFVSLAEARKTRDDVIFSVARKMMLGINTQLIPAFAQNF